MRGLLAGALAIALAPLPACVWSDGEPFGIVSTTLDARWREDPARGGAWQKLASDFEVQVSAASATLGPLALIDVGSAALNFDPAAPPPGYSLCHNGHCHADDGRLVPYDEIAAELAGGGGPAPALQLSVGDRALLPGATDALTCGGAACDVGLATIRRVELPVTHLALAGMVRDTRQPPRITGEAAWTLALDRAADAAPATAAVDLPIDRGHDPAIDLAITFAPTAALLDGVGFQLAGTGTFAVDGDPASLATIHHALDELALGATVDR